MERTKMTCERARSLCLIATLAGFGHFPKRKSEKEAWFLSPFRSEAQASFKVSLRHNTWIDFGTYEKGDVIDLTCRLNRCNVPQALDILNGGNISTLFKPVAHQDNQGFEIISSTKIQHPALLDYLYKRRIPTQVAHRFCKEVWYAHKGKRYFAIGLPNSASGWELRNPYFKSTTSPKTISHFRYGKKRLLVTEGMFDLLALHVLLRLSLLDYDLVVLNSLGLIHQLENHLPKYESVHLFLDNDEPGDKYTARLLTSNPKCRDERNLYYGFKDANEKLMT